MRRDSFLAFLVDRVARGRVASCGVATAISRDEFSPLAPHRWALKRDGPYNWFSFGGVEAVPFQVVEQQSATRSVRLLEILASGGEDEVRALFMAQTPQYGGTAAQEMAKHLSRCAPARPG